MILRHEGATFSLAELELPKDAMDTLCLAAPRPSACAMIGHRPVLCCDSGSSMLLPPESSSSSWLEDELLPLKAVGA